MSDSLESAWALSDFLDWPEIPLWIMDSSSEWRDWRDEFGPLAFAYDAVDFWIWNRIRILAPRRLLGEIGFVLRNWNNPDCDLEYFISRAQWHATTVVDDVFDLMECLGVRRYKYRAMFQVDRVFWWMRDWRK